MGQKLEDMSKEDFYKLKATGMLWELFPDAPEFYEGIRRMRCTGPSGMCSNKESGSNQTKRR